MGARRLRRQRGVTLVELMITVFVLAILSAIAAPNLRDAMRRGEVKSAATALQASIAYARSEAVTRGTFVSICPSTDGESCASDTAYESGWVVYAYPVGADGADQGYDADDKRFALLRRVEAISGTALTASDKQVISFGQQGQLLRDASVRFAVCAKGSDGGAVNTEAVKGALVELGESGGSHLGTLKVGGGCSPNG